MEVTKSKMKKSWNPQESYEKVNKNNKRMAKIGRKDAYNKMFAVSAHAEKIVVKQ